MQTQIPGVPASGGEAFVIRIRENGHFVFQSPPSVIERKFMTTLRFMGSHVLGRPSQETQISAVLPIVDVFRISMGYSFLMAGSDYQANNTTVAEAVLNWMEATGTKWSQLNMDPSTDHTALQTGSSGTDDWAQALAMSIEASFQFFSFGSLEPDPLERHELVPVSLGTEPLALPSAAPSRRRGLSISTECNETVPQSPKRRRLMLEEELQKVQRDVGHIPKLDVHRGRGQAVKNLNAKYSELINKRAKEYIAVREDNKAKTSESKHSIALEILIDLAKTGGRIRDVDNRNPLANDKAVKKVMNALKDKARKMKEKSDTSDENHKDCGSLGSHQSDSSASQSLVEELGLGLLDEDETLFSLLQSRTSAYN